MDNKVSEQEVSAASEAVTDTYPVMQGDLLTEVEIPRAASEGVPEPERDPSTAFANWFKNEDFGDGEQLQRAFFAGIAFMAGIAAVDPRLVSVDKATIWKLAQEITPF